MSAPLYQTEQIQALESLVMKNGLHAVSGLMELAGEAAFTILQKYWPKAKRIIVCCGKGNNGGDGYVLANFADQAGLKVSIYSIGDILEFKDAALAAARRCEASGIPIQKFTPNLPFDCDVIVDALLGTGLRDDVKEPYYHFIQAINETHLPVLAIDIPSGLDANTGDIHGIVIKAQATITMMGLKAGLFTYHGPSYCGEIECNSLGTPPNYLNKVQPVAELLHWSELQKFLPKRVRDSNKGDYGHVLVIGGDYGMGGAVRMSAEAALRVGAGLVSVATRPEHVTAVNCSRPEIMCHQITRENDLDALLERATVVVIGPGLGKSDWSKMLLNKILSSKLPKVVDADGLNLLSEDPHFFDQWVLTPHPGEAARLLGIATSEIQNNRFQSSQAIQKKYGGIVTLKGAGTVIAGPDFLPQVCPAGNPGMASGGMGDVLSGVIGGLIAQKIPLGIAGQLGVFIHSLAADQAAAVGGERGLLATDLMDYLRELANPVVNF